MRGSKYCWHFACIWNNISPASYLCIIAAEPTERWGCENWNMKLSLPSVIDFSARSKLVFSAFWVCMSSRWNTCLWSLRRKLGSGFTLSVFLSVHSSTLKAKVYYCNFDSFFAPEAREKDIWCFGHFISKLPKVPDGSLLAGFSWLSCVRSAAHRTLTSISRSSWQGAVVLA